MQIGEVFSNGTRDSQQFRIGFPVGPRTILERNAECFRRSPCDSRLEKNMNGWRGNETKNGTDGPCQNPRLPARKRHHRLTPAGESFFHVACAMKEIVKTLSKGPG